MAKKRLQKGGQVQDDSITIRLRLTGLRVLAVKEAGKWIEVVAQYRDNEAVCPRCERSTWQVHQWHIQRKRDAKLWGKEVWVALLKRRFRCRHCRKVFTEPDPACGPRRRTTGRLRQRVARRAREATVRSVAREEGVSEGLVERSWVEAHSLVSPPARPHVFLGLDGFCVRRPGRMWTGMWDLESGKAVAVVPGEREGCGHRPVRGLPAGGGAGAAGCPDRGRQVPRLSPGRPRPPRSARRDSAARQPSLAPAERGGEAEPAGANTSAAGASGRPSACPCLGPQGGPAGSVQEEAARGGSRGPGALDQGSGGKRPPTLPAHRGYAQEVAEGGPELLALPDHKRLGGGQAQPHQDSEEEGLRLPERQELSAKNP